MCQYTPTAGIDIGHHSIEGAGNFSIWDYAGHEEFHVTHSLFLGGDNAIFLVAYDLSVLMLEDDKARKYYEKVIQFQHRTYSVFVQKLKVYHTHLF